MIIAETTKAVDKAVDKDTTNDTKIKSSTYDCKDCGTTRKVGKDNMRQAGSEYNAKTKTWDTIVQFIYWDICKFCADKRIKA